jgi:hypothetical protein
MSSTVLNLSFETEGEFEACRAQRSRRLQPKRILIRDISVVTEATSDSGPRSAPSQLGGIVSLAHRCGMSIFFGG